MIGINQGLDWSFGVGTQIIVLVFQYVCQPGFQVKWRVWINWMYFWYWDWSCCWFCFQLLLELWELFFWIIQFMFILSMRTLCVLVVLTDLSSVVVVGIFLFWSQALWFTSVLVVPCRSDYAWSKQKTLRNNRLLLFWHRMAVFHNILELDGPIGVCQFAWDLVEKYLFLLEQIPSTSNCSVAGFLNFCILLLSTCWIACVSAIDRLWIMVWPKSQT